jgi:hypothetical protein
LPSQMPDTNGPELGGRKKVAKVPCNASNRTESGLEASCWMSRNCAALLPVAGFRRALARLPLAALRAVAAGVRQQLSCRLDLLSDGFVVLGCDGSARECPRSAE